MTRKLVTAHNISSLLFVRARNIFMRFHYNIFSKKNKVFLNTVKNNQRTKKKIHTHHRYHPNIGTRKFFTQKKTESLRPLRSTSCQRTKDVIRKKKISFPIRRFIIFRAHEDECQAYGTPLPHDLREMNSRKIGFMSRTLAGISRKIFLSDSGNTPRSSFHLKTPKKPSYQP